MEGGLTNEGQMLGTPDYIAPEQIRDAQSADIRADIYSLGCTLYYLLTGGPPFREEKLWDLYQAHFSRDAEPLNLVRPEVPSELAALVGKMMAKEPSERFQTPGEVAEALRPFFKKPSVRAVGTSGSSDEVKAAPPPPLTGSPEAQWATLINVKTGESTPTSALTPVAVASSEPGTPPRGRMSLLAAGLLFAGLVVAWASGAFKVKAQDGTIVFEDLPDQAVVKVDGDACTVVWPEGEGQGHARVTLPAGKHYVQVELDGVKVTGERVTVESGRGTPFSIGREALATIPKEPLSEKLDAPKARPSAFDKSSLSEKDVTPKTRPTAFDPDRFQIDGGQWIVQGDELIQTDARVHWPCLMFGDASWTDYDFSADVFRIHGREACNLVFRGADADHNLFFANSAYTGTSSQIEANQGGSLHWLGGTPHAFEGRKWYRAHVRVRGGQIVATLHDGSTEVARVAVHDTSRPGGRVGLRTWYSAYRFKNIKVTAPDGTVLWQGPPRIASLRPARLASTEANLYRSGWISLFNGTDLAGWSAFFRDEDIKPDQLFYVDQHELVSFPGKYARLSTQSAYSQFLLSFDYYIARGDDAGLSFMPALPDGTRGLGFECQIRGEEPNDAHGCGDLYGAPGLLTTPAPNSRKAEFFPRTRRADQYFDGWNAYDIKFAGRRITVTLNGVVVNQVDTTWDGPWYVCPQTEASGSVRFRNIAIKGINRLNPTVDPRRSSVAASESPAPSAPALVGSAKGFSPMFQDKGLSGWNGLPGFWRVEGGALHVAQVAGSQQHTFLISRRTYRDFILRFKVRRQNGQGNSGVQFRSTVSDRAGSKVVGPQCEIAELSFKYPPGSVVTEPQSEPALVASREGVAQVYKEGDFNNFEIKVVGKHVTIVLNNMIVIDRDFPSMPPEGVIAWQLHGRRSPLETIFKDVFIKELRPGAAD